MESFELEPKYSTKEIPGRCLKCLAEDELNSCLMLLLRDEAEEDAEKIQQRFEALLAFLQSPELKHLRDKSERYLAEGKEVKLLIGFKNNKPTYELKID